MPAELRKIHVVVCAIAYQHLGDVDHVSKVLASLLKKEGCILVIDYS
jgi:hypothetical protein